MGLLDRRQNIFSNPLRVLPKSDPQEVGIDMTQTQLFGRHDAVPTPKTNHTVVLKHIADSAPVLGGNHITPGEFRAKWRK